MAAATISATADTALSNAGPVAIHAVIPTAIPTAVPIAEPTADPDIMY